MDHTNHTARYQLDRFLNSQNSYDYDLDAIDIAILYAITYYIDCEKDGRNACCAKQITLANRCRVDRKTVTRRLQKFKKMNLIEVTRHWKLLWIILGENLIKYLPGTLSSTSGVHDQGTGGYTTIEDKKQKRRERQQQSVILSLIKNEEELELIETHESLEVEDFIKSISGQN